mgnify:FL=1
MESKTTIFYVGEETKPVVENLKRLKESIFSYHIDKSIHLIDEHLSVDPKEANDAQDYVNNIIAFVGERGAGKTSCMCSVISILQELQNKKAYNTSFDNLKTLPQKRIHALKLIDPSFFDAVHNILEIIIGEMYNRTSRDLSTSITVDKENEARKLLKSFQAIKRDMLYVDKNTRFERDEELEELSLLAAGVDLRTGIQKLIADYLSYFNSDVLLISIDDIDLNVKLAYEMVEQIRKYLILPNVMILMAVKIDQLSMVIQENLSKQFDQALKHDTRILTGNDISEMAERYINKLIPIESRIYIPSPDVFFGNSLVIKDRENVVFEADTVRDAIPSLIFTKCRYLFYNTRGTTSPIVPRNLRDLRLLLQMLIKMKDYSEVKPINMTEALGNKQQFKRYFFSTWLDSLEVDVRSVAIKLINETEPTLFNKKVIDLIRNMYADATSKELKSHKMYFDIDSAMAKDANEIKVEDNFRNILEPKNLAYNISIGDVFYVLDRLLRMETSASVHRLIFFIKALYSIKLYEWYDEMTDMNETTKKPLPTEKKPYAGDFLVNINDYMKLVGGNFFCLDGETVLPPKRINSFVEREIRLINGKTFFELLKQVLHICRNSPTHENEMIQLAEEDLTKMHVVEFFMLTISRYVWTTDKTLSESGSHRYRLGADAFYNRQIGEQMTNLKFDFLSPFFTLIDIEHSYGRFNEEIFGYAKRVENSLYNKIMGLFEFDRHRHLSSICIRNAEVLDELFSRIKSRRGSLRSSDDSKIFGSIYNEIANFEIATHDYETKEGNQKEYYTIQFPDFSVLSNLFSDLGFVALFESIYNRNDQVDQSAIEMVTSYFNDFLNSYLKKKQSTIISCLKKHNKDFYDRVGEDAIKEQFNDTNKSYSKNEQINGLAQIITETPSVLVDLRSEADEKKTNEDGENTTLDSSDDSSSGEEGESAPKPSDGTITEEGIAPKSEV